MLPLAAKLYEEDQAENWWQILSSSDETSVCPLFEPHSEGVSTMGRCSRYGYRPSVCRLFGASFVKTKDQSATPLICKILKDQRPLNQPSEFNIETLNSDVPIAQNWSSKMDSLAGNPNLNEKHPINIALKLAIQTLFWQEMPTF